MTNLTIENVETRGEQEPLPNPSRGCGHLSRGKSYVVGCGFSPDGVLPSWVEIDPYLPFREIGTEGQFTRSFVKIDGLTLQIALEEEHEFIPKYPDGPAGHVAALNNLVEHGVYDNPDVPKALSEAERHVDRIRFRGTEDGTHWGNIPVTEQTDLLMRAGASYYDEPEDYAEEARKYSVSKAIPVAPNRDPPDIVNGITRCWIMHPEACEGTGGGIIGYAYLSEVAYTRPEGGELPDYIEDLEQTGDLAVREIEPPQPPEDDDEDDEDDDQAALDGFGTEESDEA